MGDLTRRTLLARAAALAAVGPALVGSGAACAPAGGRPLPPISPDGAGWRRYPYVMFDDPTFTFPTIEGRTTNETDTWYAQGRLTGRDTGREYSFLTIFARNRVGTPIRADLYTFAVFPLDATDHASYTDSDIAPDGMWAPSRLTASAGFLDLRFDSTAGAATWTTRLDAHGRLVPFAYRLDLVGDDPRYGRMALSASMDALDPPTAPGPDRRPGIITVLGQPNTGTYFQTGLRIDGVLTFDGVTEPVDGHIGHIDRQFFPLYAGVDSGLSARDHGHDWGSIHLDDGSTISLWRQYDRRDRNRVEDFTGVTRNDPTTGARTFASEFDLTPTSYVRWPDHVPTAFPPLSPNRYLTGEHVIEVPSWDLRLVGSPITAVPAHALPVEYTSGPVAYAGTLLGQPITGFGHAEHRAAMYRRWELARVLTTTVDGLPDTAFVPGGASRRELLDIVGRLRVAADAGDPFETWRVIDAELAPAVATVHVGHRPFITRLVTDLRSSPMT